MLVTSAKYVVTVAVSVSFGIKHSYNMITNPIQVKVINPNLTSIIVSYLLNNYL